MKINQIVFVAVLAWTVGLVYPAERPARGHFEKGNELLDQEKHAEAIEQYEKAIAIDPQFVEAYYNKAMACEAVSRARGVKAWEEFIAVAEGKPSYRSQLRIIKGHVKHLTAPPPLPPALSLNNYSERDSDYCALVIKDSLGRQWTRFPVKVFVSDPPQKKMDDLVRQAVGEWGKYFPLQLVDGPKEADIRIVWAEEERPKYGTTVAGLAGEHLEVEDGDKLSTRVTSDIAVLLYRKDPRTKKEIKAVILHELGHALGIQGHSDRETDLMYYMRRGRGAVIATAEGAKRVGKSLATEISRRDVNTLIKIYNTDVLITRY